VWYQIAKDQGDLVAVAFRMILYCQKNIFLIKKAKLENHFLFALLPIFEIVSNHLVRISLSCLISNIQFCSSSIHDNDQNNSTQPQPRLIGS